MPRLLIPALHMLTVAGQSAVAEGATRPNVVSILADDLGRGDLGCYGNHETRTPNPDGLAAGGKLFTQLYVNGSVRSPGRCAFLAGRLHARHGIHGHSATPQLDARRGMSQFLDPRTTTLPRLLHRAGYATAHVGKRHLGGSPDAPSPRDHGFDTVRATTSNDDTWTGQNQDPFFRLPVPGLCPPRP